MSAASERRLEGDLKLRCVDLGDLQHPGIRRRRQVRLARWKDADPELVAAMSDSRTITSIKSLLTERLVM